MNSYELSLTAPSRQRVYRFHHLGPLYHSSEFETYAVSALSLQLSPALIIPFRIIPCQSESGYRQCNYKCVKKRRGWNCLLQVGRITYFSRSVP